MSPEELKIIEEIKVHSDIIADLTKKLYTVPVKKTKGLTPEERARVMAKLRKSMYRE